MEKKAKILYMKQSTDYITEEKKKAFEVELNNLKGPKEKKLLIVWNMPSPWGIYQKMLNIIKLVKIKQSSKHG